MDAEDSDKGSAGSTCASDPLSIPSRVINYRRMQETSRVSYEFAISDPCSHPSYQLF